MSWVLYLQVLQHDLFTQKDAGTLGEYLQFTILTALGMETQGKQSIA